MPAKLHIIASCTERKRRSESPAVRLCNIPHGPQRLVSWWEALHSNAGTRLPARDLYVGDHWAVVREMPELARERGFHADLWVASAGYGLVPSTAPLVPYSATFMSGTEDSISPATSAVAEPENRAWWNALAGQPSPVAGAPRSLAQLAKSDPRAAFMVVASPTYLRALEDDLRELHGHLSSPEHLLIISSPPGPRDETIERCWIPSMSELQHHVGGARTALHARVARALLLALPCGQLTCSAAQAHCEELMRTSPPLKQYDRERGVDDVVLAFIRSRLAEDARLSHSRLLREYRASGRACEQGRFRELFFSIKGAR